MMRCKDLEMMRYKELRDDETRGLEDNITHEKPITP